jgi:GT2 family glycosyltransferase
MTGPSVSVVVATRHRAAALDRCLAALADLTDRDAEILVVDNGPDRDTAAVARHHADGPIPVRYLVERRRGASRARNLGLAEAAGSVVAVTDDDVVVDPGWLTALRAGFTRGPGIACVTGLVLPGSLDSPAQELFETWGGFNKGYTPRVFGPRRPAAAGPLYPFIPGLYGSGNNVAFRADVLRALGGYDIALGPGTEAPAGEELDLFFALLTGGYRLAYEPAAVVWHHHRPDEEALAEQLHGYGIGLSAVMTKWATKSPGHALALARRVPAGVTALRHRSAAPHGPGRSGPDPARPLDGPHRRRAEDRVVALPRRLKVAEWRGMLAGPAALRASRRAVAAEAKQRAS